MSKYAVMPLTDYVSACESIREKTGENDSIKSGELSAKISAVYEKGKAGGGDVIDFAEYADRFSFATTEGLPETVTLNLKNANTIQSLLVVDNNNIKHLIINCDKQITLLYRVLYTATNKNVLENITLNIDTSKSTNFQQTFYNGRMLKVIDGTPLDLSSATIVSNMFGYCSNLEEVRFVSETIPISISISQPKLSLDSLLSILNGLKDYGADTETNLFDISKIPNIEGKLVNNGASLEITAPGVETVSSGVTIRELCPDLVVGETVIVSYTSSTFMASVYFGGVTLNGPSADGGTATTEVTITEEVLSKDMSFMFGTSPVTVSNIMVTRKPATATYTLSLGATNLAKLTDEQKAIATEKGWSLV